jgi:O-antigen/teichoic acid export membrane protein
MYSLLVIFRKVTSSMIKEDRMSRLASGQRAALLGSLSWIQKGCFAVIDQGLFAGVNFLVNLLLARWLEPAQYGAFATAYSAVFFLFAAFHTAVLTEPMLVFGAGKYAEGFQKYLGILILSHWGIASLIAMMLALAALVFWRLGSREMAQVMLALALSSPFILLLWLLRRAFYARVQPQWAAAGGALYLVLMLTGMYGLYWGHWLSAVSALMVMGLASLAVSLWLSTILRPRWCFVESTPTPGVVLADHWNYGRWAASAVPIMWLPSNIYFLILPVWTGLEGAAALGASMIFVMPMLNVFQAVSNLLFPLLAQQASSNNRLNFNVIIRRVLKLLLAADLIYFLLILMLGSWMLDWIYKEKYHDYAYILLVMGLLVFPFTINFILGTALRTIPLLKQIIWCYIVSSFITLTLGFWLVSSLGVFGAALGFVVSTTTTAVSLTTVYACMNVHSASYKRLKRIQLKVYELLTAI